MIPILILFIILIIYLLLLEKELFTNYKRCKEIKGITKEVLSEHDINFSKKTWDLLLPCSYNTVHTELNNFSEKGKYIYAIEDCDKLVSKVTLWKMLHDFYGRQLASNLMPETFILKDPKDKKLFKMHYNSNKTYIMKNKEQRKLGIKITNDLNDILTTKDYFLVQKMIDSHKINGYKYNFRCYLLIVCDSNKKFYLHKKIKYLYTSKKATNDLLDKDQHITNSYSMEKNIYDNNPRYLDNHDIFMKIKILLTKVISAIYNKICLKIKDNTRFQLFGVDIMLDENLHPYLLEMNKGPDMKPKDNKDHSIKKKVIEDTFDKVNLIQIDNNEYQELN